MTDTKPTTKRRHTMMAVVGVMALVVAGAPASVALAGDFGAHASSTPTITLGGVQYTSTSAPAPYAPDMKSAGVPSSDQGTIAGSGFAPDVRVYAEVCDGANPTKSNWSPAVDCAYANGGTVTDASGNLSIDTSIASYQFEGPFHGEAPLSSKFNCLAPADNPNGTGTVVGAQPISSAIPSWGSTSGAGAGGGGVSPCQLRFSTSLGTYQTSDIFVPLADLDSSGTGTAPAAPTGVTVTPGVGSASVAFTVPSADTGDSFKLVAEDQTHAGAPATAAGSGSPITVTGLTLGDTYSFEVVVTASNGSSQSSPMTATIPSAAKAAVLAAHLASGKAGVAYHQDVIVNGTPPFTVTTSGAVPPGLKVSSSGALSGTPTRAGHFSFTVHAKNGAGTTSGTVHVTISAGNAARAVIVSGNKKTVAEHKTFPTLEVKVTDKYGDVVAGHKVSFRVSGPASFHGKSSATATSAGNGVAKAPALTAGKSAGTVKVTVTGAGPTVKFTLHVKK